MFQTLSIPRRSWIMIAWMNAVPISQGMIAEFSTASQPQEPPKPCTRYAHQTPSKFQIPRVPQATGAYLRVVLIELASGRPAAREATANANGMAQDMCPAN